MRGPLATRGGASGGAAAVCLTACRDYAARGCGRAVATGQSFNRSSVSLTALETQDPLSSCYSVMYRDKRCHQEGVVKTAHAVAGQRMLGPKPNGQNVR